MWRNSGRQADFETLSRQLLERGRHRIVDDRLSVRDTAGTAQASRMAAFTPGRFRQPHPNLAESDGPDG